MTEDQDPYTWLNPRVLTTRGLFEQALVEVDALGTQPRSSPGRWCWEEERRGSMCALAALAGQDGHLLRRAALHIATGPRHRNRKAAQMLRDATHFAWRDQPSDRPIGLRPPPGKER